MTKKIIFTSFLLVASVFTGFSVFAQEVEIPVTETELEVVETPEIVVEQNIEELQGITSCEDIVNTTDLAIYLGMYGTVDFDCFSQAVVEIVNEPVIIFPGDKIEDYIQVSIDGNVNSLSEIDGVLNFVMEEVGMGSVTVFTPHNLPNWAGNEKPKKEHALTVEIEWYDTCEEILSSTQLITLYLMHYNANSLNCVTQSSQLNYVSEVTIPQGGDLIDYVELFVGEDSIDPSELSAFVIVDDNFSTNTPGQFTVQVAMAHPATAAVLAEFIVTIESTILTNARISPILECVATEVDGSYIAYFGYENFNTTAIEIRAGDLNRITGGGLEGTDQGQVTTFEYPAPNHPEGRPGRTGFYPNFAFSVAFDGTPLVWTLTGPDGATRTSTASSQGTQCPDIETEEDDTDGETSTNGGGGGSSSSGGSFTGGNFSSGQVLGTFDTTTTTTTTTTEGEVLGESATSCPIFFEFHRKGDRGGQVSLIQDFLNTNLQSNLAVDGIFGPMTEKAVHNFQQKYWEQTIKPWTPELSERTTGRWYKTTSAWANTLSGCVSAPVFLEDTGEMYTPATI